MSNTTLVTQVTTFVNEMDTSDLVELHNLYCDNNNDSGSHIHDNDEDNINNFYDNAFDAIRSAFYGDYNPSSNYFTFNGYGNLISFDYPDEVNSPICKAELVEYIIDSELYDSLGIEVVTIDDMLASIEDNITDDENLLLKLAVFLTVVMDNDSYEDNVYDCMVELNNYTYEQLENIMILLGINY